jgi:hypothetical protein
MNIRVVIALTLAIVAIHAPSNGQRIPDLKLRQQQPAQNDYVKLLGLEDEHALIIKFSITSSWDAWPYDSFIAYTHSGKVYRCELPAERHNNYNSRCSKKQEATGEDLKRCWEMLAQIADSNMIDINSSLLNSTEVLNDKGKWEVTYLIEDASEITIEVAQDNRHEHFYSYAPYDYSKINCRGAADMQKLIKLFNLITDFTSRQPKKDLLPLKNSDTVYIRFDGRKEGQRRRFSRWDKNAWWYIFYTSRCDSIIFDQRAYLDADAIARNQPADVRIVPDSFLEKNKSTIVDQCFIVKYDRFFRDVVRRKKTIYLIDESLRRPGEVVLQQVFPLFFDE